MENFEKINALLEGELNDKDQKDLFAELSMQDSLRNQFKSLALMNSTLKDQSHVAPIPLASSNKIFDSVGINRKTSAGAFLGFFNSKIFVGTASSIITILIMLLFFNDKSDTIIAKIQENSQPITKTSSIIENENKSNIPESTSMSNKQVNNNYKSNRAEGQKSTIENESQNIQHIDNDLVQIEKENDHIASNFVFHQRKVVENENNPFENSYTTNQFSTIENFNSITNNDLQTYSSKEKRFSFEFRGFQDWMMPESKIGPAQIAKFHNTAISLEYQVSQNHAFGFDLRNETFLMNFSGENNFGMPVNYSVHPNLISAGLYYRYSMRHLGSVYPIAQIYLGGNEIGGVGRIMSGAAIRYNDFEMVLGVEYSSMLYEFQNDIYNSSKIGLNYGIKYYIF